MYIDKPTCHAAVRALVTPRPGYATCNSLHYGISSVDCQRLQRLQPYQLQNTYPSLQMSQYRLCAFIPNGSHSVVQT